MHYGVTTAGGLEWIRRAMTAVALAIMVTQDDKDL